MFNVAINLCFILALQVVDSNESSQKRLLLHSQEDLVQRIIKLEAELEALKNTSKQTGYTAGRYLNDPGSGTTNLCLPQEPKWASYVDGSGDGGCCRAHIYGTEIDIEEPNHIFNFAINNQDMPCAVCKSPRSISLMIPARKECFPGWTLEYWGYLMAAIYNRPGGNDYICMDGKPEFNQHGGTNDNEHVLYIVEAQCGSLPCPPYVQGRELPCAICSQ